MVDSESASSSSTDHGAPTDERSLTLDERVLRGKSEHTCLKRLDELMYCLSERLRPLPDVSHNDPQSSPAIGAAPTNQFAKYYREGTYDYCPARFKAWHLCLKMKLSKPERAAELQQEARQRPHARWHDMHAHARWHDMHAHARMLLPFDSCRLPCAPGVGQDRPTHTPLGVPPRVRG